MGALRSTLLGNYRLALLLAAVALALRLVLPAGTMLGGSGTVLTVEICADASGGEMVREIVVPQGGKSGAGGFDHGAAAHGACPWSALSLAATGAADTALLVLALAFALLLGFAPLRIPRLPDHLHLRPPLRGPPEPA